MKKITGLVVFTLGLVLTGFTQTQRTLLYEEFSGENCLGCELIDQGLVNFIHRSAWYPSNIVLIRYESPLPNDPGPGSLFDQNKTDVNTRLAYYRTPFAPFGNLDGGVLAAGPHSGGFPNGYASILEDSTDYPHIIADSALVNSPFALTVSHQFNATGDSVTVTAVVTAAQNYSASSSGALVLQVALEEAQIFLPNPVGGNGEQHFYNVMRKMLPSALGTVLNDTWTNTATQTYTLKTAVPSYIYDKNQICFVAFIQDGGPKRVHQAAYSPPKPVNLDAGTAALTTPSTLCSTTFTVHATLQNKGATTLTALNINYQLDAYAVTTYAWTGSLAPGATLNYPVNLSTTAGKHTVTVYTSLPNGSTDENPNNDKQAITVFVESAALPAPLMQGFQSGTFPPSNWFINSENTGVASLWTISTAGIGGNGTSTLSAKYPFFTNPRMGDIDDLYTQAIDLTSITSPQLRFDYAYDFVYQSPVEYDDTLAVSISSDCGITWNRLFYEGGHILTTVALADTGISGAFTPTSAQWRTAYLDLSAYATANNVLLKFSAINGYGSYLYLDNINVVTATTGIQEAERNTPLVLYPNPNTGSFVLEPNSTTKQTMLVYDAQGRLVYSQAIQGKTDVDLSFLNEGVYTISLCGEKGVVYRRVVVVR